MKPSWSLVAVLWAASLVCPRSSLPQPARTAPDPVGTYDVDFEMNGQLQTAVLVISQESNGHLTGTLDVHGQSLSLDAVSDGNDLTLTPPDGSDLRITLTFKTNNQLSGTWSMHGNSGGLNGVRRKG
jgi:hypothetical protein